MRCTKCNVLHPKHRLTTRMVAFDKSSWLLVLCPECSATLIDTMIGHLVEPHLKIILDKYAKRHES